MYSPRRLKAIARYKEALRNRIATRRRICAVAATRVAQPLRQIDVALALWRRAAPFARLAAIPLGWLLFRRRPGLSVLLGFVWRWFRQRAVA